MSGEIRIGDRVRSHDHDDDPYGGLPDKEWIVDRIVAEPRDDIICVRGPCYRVRSREKRRIAWFCRDELTRLDWLDD